MNKFRYLLMVFVFLFSSYCVSIYAMVEFSAIKLPRNFHVASSEIYIPWFTVYQKEIHALNNLGQVAGYVGETIDGRKAAIWDPISGSIGLYPGGTGNIATAINDQGWVTIYSGGHVFLWNVKTNEQINGPKGRPCAISNNGIVLIQVQQGFRYILWDFKNNEITSFNEGSPVVELTDDGIPCLENHSSSGKCYTSSRLNYNDEILTWFYEGKYHFLCSLPVNACLNYKRNEVFVSGLLPYAIFTKNGMKKISVTPQLPFGCGNIYGFVSSGKALLGGQEFNRDFNLYLLIPINK